MLRNVASREFVLREFLCTYICMNTVYVRMYVCTHQDRAAHTYVHMYVHMCIHTQRQRGMYIRTYIRMHIRMHVCMYVHTLCKYIHTYIHMHVRMYVCMYACMYVHYVRTHMHIRCSEQRMCECTGGRKQKALNAPTTTAFMFKMWSQYMYTWTEIVGGHM